jgi:hypothetical protein
MKKAPLSVFCRESGASISSGRSLEPVPESKRNVLDPGGHVQSHRQNARDRSAPDPINPG